MFVICNFNQNMFCSRFSNSVNSLIDNELNRKTNYVNNKYLSFNLEDGIHRGNKINIHITKPTNYNILIVIFSK